MSEIKLTKCCYRDWLSQFTPDQIDLNHDKNLDLRSHNGYFITSEQAEQVVYLAGQCYGQVSEEYRNEKINMIRAIFLGGETK